MLPASPAFRPTKAVAQAVVAALTAIAPEGTVTTEGPGAVQFVDAGANFESVQCPACGLEIDVDWWSEQMSVAYTAQFKDLSITTPCCSTATTLNDLDYVWPQGFASWWVEAMNPNRGPLTDDEVQTLRNAMGDEVRIVWTHV